MRRKLSARFYWVPVSGGPEIYSVTPLGLTLTFSRDGTWSLQFHLLLVSLFIGWVDFVDYA
jgi:hypothetical protein